MVLSTLLQNRVVLFPTSEPHGPLSIYLLQNLMVLPLFPSEPCGPLFTSEPPGPLPFYLLQNLVVLLSFPLRTAWSSSFYFRSLWPSFSMATARRFKSQHPSSFAAPFLTPPTFSYTCPHPRILPAFLGCHSKSGQVWPHGVEPIISMLSRRPCNQGELLPSPILGGIRSHPPGSKHGHSYLTHP